MAGPVVIGFDGSPGAVRAIDSAAQLFPGARALVVTCWRSSAPAARAAGTVMSRGMIAEGVEKLDATSRERALATATEGAAARDGGRPRGRARRAMRAGVDLERDLVAGRGGGRLRRGGRRSRAIGRRLGGPREHVARARAPLHDPGARRPGRPLRENYRRAGPGFADDGARPRCDGGHMSSAIAPIPMRTSAEPGGSAVVRGRELVKRYGEGATAVDALRGVSADFAPGTFTAIMGPSGSGKSTLMHILAGLDRPTSGWVELGGTRLDTLSDHDLTLLRRSRIGFVFQTFNLLPVLTAAENIALPVRIAGEEPNEAWFDTLVDAVDLGDRLEHRPGELSGGQQQRVAIARALLTPSRRRLRGRAHRQPRLRRRPRRPRPPAARRRRVRPDADHGHPRRDRGGDRRPRAVPRRRPDRRRRRGALRRRHPRPAEGPPMRALVLRGIAQRRLRSLLTGIAVLLGVAMIAGTYITTDQIQRAFTEITQANNAGSDAVITPPEAFRSDINNGEQTLPESLVARVRSVSGVADVAAGPVDARLHRPARQARGQRVRPRHAHRDEPGAVRSHSRDRAAAPRGSAARSRSTASSPSASTCASARASASPPAPACARRRSSGPSTSAPARRWAARP